MLNSRALTKTQSMYVIAIIVVVAVMGYSSSLIISDYEQPSNSIKIGVFTDLDSSEGQQIWQGAVLAAEQLNAKGGILGKQIEVVGEDNDVYTQIDMTTVSTALSRLISIHNVDFIIGGLPNEIAFTVQDVISDHKIIYLATSGSSDEITQRVLDDYGNYKYFFTLIYNNTQIFEGITDSLQLLKEETEFKKIAYLAEDLNWAKGVMNGLDYVLPERYNYDIVYKGTYPLGTVDFSSYFAAAEQAGAEILIPLSTGQEGLVIVQEWYDRQSPMVIYSGGIFVVAYPEAWEWTSGKCEYVSVSQTPITVGYPITSKTLPTREAFINKWGVTPGLPSAQAYDILGIILPDAIERARTIETEAVIEALENTSIETTQAKNFVFTPSHGVMMGENPNDPEADHMLIIVFQWQNGEMIPVHPRKIMEEAGATYTFPDWPGPWDDLN